VTPSVNAGPEVKVSVIIPAYNSADYTVETVASVLAQTYKNYEVIVVDDGSSDHTREALEQFSEQITYIYKENGGACSARNVGIRHARGEYLACLDCDDLWLPDKLQCSVAKLDAEKELALVFTSCYLIDKDSHVIGKTNYKVNLDNTYVRLLKENYIVAPTVVMRRSCLDQVGLFDESIFIPADWDLWLRLARDFPIGYIDKSLSKYRMVSNYTQRNSDQYVDETLYMLKQHFNNAPFLSQRDRDSITSRLYVKHGILYRESGAMDNARRRLFEALKLTPFSVTPYFHLTLSCLGRSVWTLVDRVKGRLGGWMVKIDGEGR